MLTPLILYHKGQIFARKFVFLCIFQEKSVIKGVSKHMAFILKQKQQGIFPAVFVCLFGCEVFFQAIGEQSLEIFCAAFGEFGNVNFFGAIITF